MASPGGPVPHYGWLRRLAACCWRYPGSVILAVGGAILVTVIAVAVPLVQRQIIDKVIVRHTESIWPLAAFLLAAVAVGFAGRYLRLYVGVRLALDVQHDLRTELFTTVSRLDGARQDEMSTGQLVSRSIADITMVEGLLQMVPVAIGDAVLFAVSIPIMLALSPLLTIVMFAAAPAMWLLASAAKRTLFPASWHASAQAAGIARIVNESVSGVRVVKGFGQEAQELERLEKASKDLFASRVRMARLMARFNPALAAVPSFGLVGVLAFGGWLAVHGSLTLGTFLAFSTYLAQMFDPVRTLTNLVTIGQEARASVIRVFDVIDCRPVIADRPGAAPLPKEASGIEFDAAQFGYHQSEPVLSGLSLRIEPGETVALVGMSGSGKSTIAALVPRFYDVTDGAVRIGGHDVRDVTRDSLLAAIGLVPQDSILFSETVRANIAYGRPHATDDQVVTAATAVQAHEFITQLPNGYDTMIGERGLTLSGGQRQRIALARALITDPRLLLLDDATSAIDARVEAEIHATLRQAMRGRTTLLIAHRRSTLHLADRIAVLAGGRVIDTGRHEDLMARCPPYRALLTAPDDDATSAGDATSADEAASAAARPARAISGNGHGGGHHDGSGGVLGSIPPSQELLARVDALPPARDVPGVPDEQARATGPRFTIRRLLRPLAAAIAVALVLDGLDALANLVLPALVKGGIDQGVEMKAFRVVVVVSLVGVAVVVADWLINAVQTMVVGRNSERLLYTLRVKIFAQLQRLGLDYYEREMSGSIMTRMTTDVDALSTFLQTGLITMVSSLLTFAGVLAAMLIINLRLGLFVLAMVPPLVVLTVVVRTRSYRAYQESREKVSVVNADLQENVAGLRVTQAYGREGRNLTRFAGRSAAYRAARLRAQRYIALWFPSVQALSTITGAAVLVVAVGEVRNGTLTAGALIAYLLYIDMVFAPVQQMSQVFDSYQQATVGLRRIKDLLRLPTSTPASPHPVLTGRLDGRIELRDVRFSYASSGREAIRGVNLIIEPGETVSLVGETGAGKSTLVKLIARFYDVTAGAISVDRTDIRDYDLTAYRHRLGVVPQEVYLFAGTVRDVIAYGRPEASDAEVEQAAREVAAHEMIAALPGGYHHQVTERGRNLSAGQRQLLALARARLVDPDILLLDEATASLDLATEAAVGRGMRRLAARCTTLVVAHRLSTAAMADRIVVLDNGQVAEVGSHRELLVTGGLYADMWERSAASANLNAFGMP